MRRNDKGRYSLVLDALAGNTSHIFPAINALATIIQDSALLG